MQRQNSGIIAHGRDHRGKKPDSTVWPQRHARVETQLGRRNRDASGHEVPLGGAASAGRRLTPDRKRAGEGKRGEERGDLGGGRTVKKKKIQTSRAESIKTKK